MTQDEIREATGSVHDDRALVSFLYELLRDYLPASDVEIIVERVEAERNKLPVKFTNGFLAKYAQFLSYRLGVRGNRRYLCSVDGFSEKVKLAFREAAWTNDSVPEIIAIFPMEYKNTVERLVGHLNG